MQFIYHSEYGNVSELKKYSGEGKQHQLSCKSCADTKSRTSNYCRICTFKGPNFPDIIPVHTNLGTHSHCSARHQEDIEAWGYYPVKPKKATS